MGTEFKQMLEAKEPAGLRAVGYGLVSRRRALATCWAKQLLSIAGSAGRFTLSAS